MRKLLGLEFNEDFLHCNVDQFFYTIIRALLIPEAIKLQIDNFCSLHQSYIYQQKLITNQIERS